jgi:hypothetical protein
MLLRLINYTDMTPDGSYSEVQDALAARGYTDMSTRRWAVIQYVKLKQSTLRY